MSPMIVKDVREPTSFKDHLTLTPSGGVEGPELGGLPLLFQRVHPGHALSPYTAYLARWWMSIAHPPGGWMSKAHPPCERFMQSHSDCIRSMCNPVAPGLSIHDIRPVAAFIFDDDTHKFRPKKPIRSLTVGCQNI